jgi:hypothetical protein
MIIKSRTIRGRSIRIELYAALMLSTGLSVAFNSPVSAQTSQDVGTVQANKAN